VYGVTLADEELAWRKTLARRYSWVPIVTGSGTLWALITLVFFLAYLRVRYRRRARLALMELEDRAQEAALRIAAAEQQREEPALRDREEETPPPKPMLH
jgi:beta-lactamase regulating signal transducer with metallopeptidase domain